MPYEMNRRNAPIEPGKLAKPVLKSMEGRSIRNYRKDLSQVESEPVSELKRKLNLPVNLDSWLPSERFHRVKVPTDLFAMPTLPHSPPALDDLSAYEYLSGGQIPIVIDQNINGAGRAPNMDYTPMVIIVWGQVRYMQALETKTRFVSAWVGQDVFELMEIL